jgi:hypothetical protein
VDKVKPCKLGFATKGFVSRLMKDKKDRMFLIVSQVFGPWQAALPEWKSSFAREMIWD